MPSYLSIELYRTLSNDQVKNYMNSFMPYWLFMGSAESQCTLVGIWGKGFTLTFAIVHASGWPCKAEDPQGCV